MGACFFALTTLHFKPKRFKLHTSLLQISGCFCVNNSLYINQTQSNPSAQKKENIGVAWLIWGLAAAFYFSDYMARVAVSVMHRYLQIDFNMNEAQFGILSASFYVPYILMQIPVGLMLDRLSIRLVLTVMSLLTAVGCCVFGLADSLIIAAFGRMLIGFTAAFAFISTLRLATVWFPPSMMGLLAGLTQAVGMLGAASGQAPVAFLVASIGWRHSMLVMASIFTLLSIFLYQYVRDTPQVKSSKVKIKPIKKTGVFDSLRTVLSMPQTWINGLYTGFLFAPTAVIGESLGAAYLQYGRELKAHSAAFVVGLIFIGWTLGGPLAGWLSDRIGRRKPIMIFSALSGIILSSVIIFSPEMSQSTATILFFLFGFTNIGVSIAYAVATELHHRAVIGTAIAFTNMASIFIGAICQPLVGLFIDHISGARANNVGNLHLADFQYGLQLLPICSLIALFLAFMVKETFCNPLKNED
ncbi:MAG: MFS transporter [Gammaproteobacteria bacterium]|nr:MFS transporter [Gammaproteobacteria bacterium]